MLRFFVDYLSECILLTANCLQGRRFACVKLRVLLAASFVAISHAMPTVLMRKETAKIHVEARGGGGGDAGDSK